MTWKTLGDVGDGVGDKGPMLFVRDFEPAVIMDRLGARIGPRAVATASLIRAPTVGTETLVEQESIKTPMDQRAAIKKLCIAQLLCMGEIAPMREDDLSILVVDENRLRARVIEDALHEAGYARVVVVHEITGLVRRIEDTAPDVIVIDIENPNRDALESLFQVSRSVQRPIAMFVDHSDRGMIEAAVEAGVSAYIVDGLKKERVKPILDMAIIRFKAFAKLRGERDDAKQALGDRKLIDRAKGKLMQQRGIDEPAAYDLMRRAAMEENRRMVDIAQSIVTAAGLLGERGKE